MHKISHLARRMGSTPTVGSSSIMRGGWCSMATAKENRLFCPPLKCRGILSMTTFTFPPTVLMHSQYHFHFQNKAKFQHQLALPYVPQSSDQLLLGGEFKELLKKFSPGSHVFQFHAMQNPKVVECLAHSEVSIESHLLHK